MVEAMITGYLPAYPVWEIWRIIIPTTAQIIVSAAYVLWRNKTAAIPISVLAARSRIIHTRSEMPNPFHPSLVRSTHAFAITATINWKDFQLEPLELEWDIDAARDFEFSMPFGIEMVNDVILKPYSVVTVSRTYATDTTSSRR